VRAPHLIVAGLALCVAAAPVFAQSTPPGAWDFGLAAGMPLPVPSIVAIGRATWKPIHRFNFRGEATIAHAEDRRGDFVTVECDFACVPIAAPTNPTSFAGLSGHVIFNDDFITRGESGAYYALGGGIYRALSPSIGPELASFIPVGLYMAFIWLAVYYLWRRKWVVRI